MLRHWCFKAFIPSWWQDRENISDPIDQTGDYIWYVLCNPTSIILSTNVADRWRWGNAMLPQWFRDTCSPGSKSLFPSNSRPLRTCRVKRRRSTCWPKRRPSYWCKLKMWVHMYRLHLSYYEQYSFVYALINMFMSTKDPTVFVMWKGGSKWPASRANKVMGPWQRSLKSSIHLTYFTPYFQPNLLQLLHVTSWLYFTDCPSCYTVRVQLEYQLEQERRQRGDWDKSGRKLGGDSRSTQESLGEMEKNWSGLEDLIKRSETRHGFHNMWKNQVLLLGCITKWGSKR